jgi:hypothetical protein
MTRELLSFTLYWVHAAVNAHIPRKYREVLFQRVLELIQADWAATFKLASVKWEDYLVEMEERRALYAPVGITKAAPWPPPRKSQICSKINV